MATPSARATTPPPARLMARALTKRCPSCGSTRIFAGYFTMHDECPVCGLRVHRHEGQWSGDIGVNTVVTFSLLFVVLLGGALLMGQNLNVWALALAGGLVAFVMPVVFVPFAKGIWLAVDLWMKPLEPGETTGTRGARR